MPGASAYVGQQPGLETGTEDMTTRRPGRVRPQRDVNPGEIEALILGVSDDMDEEVSALTECFERAARAKVAYGVAKAKRNLEAGLQPGNGRDGRTTVDEREAMVTRDTEAELYEHLISEAHYKVSREKLATLRSQMDGLRTIAANIRAQT
jgi:hypothetical protein